MVAIPQEKPDYGNWVSRKLVVIPGALTLLFGGLSLIFPILPAAAVFFLMCFTYFAYARRRFSPAGGDFQAKIQDRVLAALDWDGVGKALDIGCGNGPLAIRLAKEFPRSEVTGIDYWGGAWEYSAEVCRRNAEIEGVAGRTSFLKATASALPFADGAFDAAVSNLVFHEVKDAPDKRAVIREALRVVRQGGSFAFQDLFLMKSMYGEIDALLAEVKSWGMESVAFTDTSKAEFIPKALKLPFMVGTIGVLHGRK